MAKRMQACRLGDDGSPSSWGRSVRPAADWSEIVAQPLLITSSEGWDCCFSAAVPRDFDLGAGSARLKLPCFQWRVVNPFVFYVLIFRSHAEDFQGVAG